MSFVLFSLFTFAFFYYNNVLTVRVSTLIQGFRDLGLDLGMLWKAQDKIESFNKNIRYGAVPF